MLLTLHDMTHLGPIDTYLELMYFEPYQGLRPIYYHEKTNENGLETIFFWANQNFCKLSDQCFDFNKS